MRAGWRAPAPLRALDWFNFLVANVQTGFGAFVAVHLTAAAWTQGQIGLVLLFLICLIQALIPLRYLRTETVVL